MIAAFLVMVWLVPIGATTVPVAVGLPIDPKLDRFALGAIFLVWLFLVGGAGQYGPGWRRAPANSAVMVFVLIAVGSVVVNVPAIARAEEMSLALKHLSLLCAYVLFFVVVATTVRKGEIPRFAVLILCLACITALGTVIEYRSGTNLFYRLAHDLLPGIHIDPEVTDQGTSRPSVTGPTQHGLADATILAMTIPIAVVGLLDARGRWKRVFYAIAFGLLFAGAVSTLRKTAIVAPVAALLPLVLYRPRQMARLLPIVALLSALVFVIAPGAVSKISDEIAGRGNLGSESNVSTLGRTSDYTAVTPDVLSHPVLGRGYGTYDPNDYMTRAVPRRHRFLDNQYLLLLIESGVLGVVAYFTIGLVAAVSLHSAARSPDRARAGPALAFIGAISAFLVASGLFDIMSFEQVPYVFFFVLALATQVRKSSLIHGLHSDPWRFDPHRTSVGSGPVRPAGGIVPKSQGQSVPDTRRGLAERLLVISPVRNEASHITRVVEAVARQTRPPDLWLVADDCSKDGTLEILRARETEIPFLSVLEVPQAAGKGRDRLALALEARAFNHALRTTNWRAFTHIGKLDGDIELPPDYFERVLGRMRVEPGIGISGGSIVELTKRGVLKQTSPPDYHVNGALKLYTRECFEAIGGIQERPAWDMIDEAYARLRGFQTVRDRTLEARHYRRSGTADGRVRGRVRNGQFAYTARYSLLWVMARAVKIGVTSDPYVISGCAYLWGYLSCLIRRAPRVEDEEFKRLVRLEHRRRVRRILGIGRASAR